jgi:hypothetical protein
VKAVDGILSEDFDFALLTVEEQAEFIELMEQVIGDEWTLTSKQAFAEALWGKVDWMLYGGAAGGGKSEFACHHVNRLSLAIPGHMSLLIRQTIPELRRSLILRLITRVHQYKLPARYRKLDGQAGFQYENGSLVECGHCNNDEDLGKYMSAEYDAIVIDEASQLSPTQIVGLASRLRTTKAKAARGARIHLGLFTNPGDVAHAWLYDLFVGPTNYGNSIVVYDVSQGLENSFPVREYVAPVDVLTATAADIYDVLLPWVRSLEIQADNETQLVVGFVQATTIDNPHVDRSTMKMLNALPERRRRQLRDGDWDTFDGQYFEQFNRSVHVIPPFAIPETWQRARGLDFGTRAPYACVWGAWDNDGDCYVYLEDYKAGLTPEEQAKLVIAKSSVDGKREKYSATVADPSVFSDKRGMGKSIADLWRDAGLHVTRAKNARIAGWSNVRQYLWDQVKERPRLFIFTNCTELVRTLPMMQHDKNNGEDVDTTLEDHAADALRYLLAVRPLGAPLPRRGVAHTLEQRWAHKIKSHDRKRAAWS